MPGQRHHLSAKKTDLKGYVQFMKSPTFKYDPIGAWLECAGGASTGGAHSFVVQTQRTSDDPAKYRLRVLYGDSVNMVALPAIDLRPGADGGPPDHEDVLDQLRVAVGLPAQADAQAGAQADAQADAQAE